MSTATEDPVALGVDDRVRVLLPDYHRWLHKVAYDLLPLDSPDHDDLAQEGRIALWQASMAYDPSREVPLEAYVKWRAVRRMREIAADRANITGARVSEGGTRGDATTAKGIETRRQIREHLATHPHATGRAIAAAVGLSEATVSWHRQRLHLDSEIPVGVTSLDALVDDGFDPTGAADVLEGLEHAYFEGRVAEALEVLTPAERRYVVLRFWYGAQGTELAEEFGYSPHGLWRTARGRLRPALEDLAP